MSAFLDKKIEFLKGVGPQKAEVLNKELGIFTVWDLLVYFPFRYEDRTRFYGINEIREGMSFVQLKGNILKKEIIGEKRKKRLVATFHDGNGTIELVWFQSADWWNRHLLVGVEYVVFGRPARFGRKWNISHPEIELLTQSSEGSGAFMPVYSSTEVLRKKFLDTKGIQKLIRGVLDIQDLSIEETLSVSIKERFSLMDRREALRKIHLPGNYNELDRAQFRLKLEELFYIQMKLLRLKKLKIQKFRGAILDQTELLTKFYEEHLPFDLTNAQKRVIKEIYKDIRSGRQMNRLLQGDVGSGKTVVAFICCLVALGTRYQAAIMAPTEILAQQHYNGLKEFAEQLGIRIAILTGSSKQRERRLILEMLKEGDLHLLVGTHALLEDRVVFNKLGLAVVDEQHRFGVAQRARLWKKNAEVYPHLLVMTATPIPRTLAMTLYGDLDVSVIDELPAGRKTIETKHLYDSNRLKLFGFVRKQIQMGRQVYFVYPLIEESETLDLKDLMDGFESVQRAFPECHVSIVHGRMKPADKEFEMQRFVKGETQIMVATTVIEVGVNVPNASVMVIENAERFGLSQLHQLRGRVGRGADQSYCILMSDVKLSKEAKVRIETMCRTNNGFDISEVDLKLRGPGDLMGTQQSGMVDLRIADLAKDGEILQLARQAAIDLLDEDPNLDKPENMLIRMSLEKVEKKGLGWSRVG